MRATVQAMAIAKAQAGETVQPADARVSSRTRSAIRKRRNQPSKPGELDVLDLAESPTGSAAGSQEGSPVAADSSPLPVVRNIVATVNLGTPVDLNDISRRARNCEYKPSRFGAMIMRIRDPRTTALVFRTGKIVVTGARSEDASMRAARKFAKIIRKLGPADVGVSDWTCQNMVASVRLGVRLNLDRLNQKCSLFCTYEPELFPGLVYRMPIAREAMPENDEKPKKPEKPDRLVFLIFVNGNVVITGAKTEEEIQSHFPDMKKLILTFRKEPRAEE